MNYIWDRYNLSFLLLLSFVSKILILRKKPTFYLILKKQSQKNLRSILLTHKEIRTLVFFVFIYFSFELVSFLFENQIVYLYKQIRYGFYYYSDSFYGKTILCFLMFNVYPDRICSCSNAGRTGKNAYPYGRLFEFNGMFARL